MQVWVLIILILAAIGYRPVGLHFHQPVIPGSIPFQFVAVKIILVDDAAHVGNGIVFIGDPGDTENGIMVSRRFDNGRLQVIVFNHIIHHVARKGKIIGKGQADVLTLR